MYRDRIRNHSLWNRITPADEAAALIKDGMTVGMSGFTRSGDAKVIPLALVRRAKTEPFQISLMTGASLGNDIDKILTESGILARRLPFQADTTLRRAINAGEVMFIDQHLSHTSELMRSQQMQTPDVALIEAVAITENGGIVPTSSVGNSANFVAQAKQIIVELNLTMSPDFEGLHDIYIPGPRPNRIPIPLKTPSDRIGLPYIPADPDKIVAIVLSEERDSPAKLAPPDAETTAIAGHLIEFLQNEVKKGRLGPSLMPIQAGVGVIANSVLQGLSNSPFHDLTMYSEVLQDSTFDLFDAGKLNFASAASFALSPNRQDEVFSNISKHRDKIVLRPQEISNHPELVRRLGIIAINTALECDIYGNVNSTHVNGTHMMNGIGGSGDFARNAHLPIFVTKSLAKDGKISSIVPMVTHVDHTEHDVGIIITEVGLADLRGLAPRERAAVIIRNCMHPSYRDLGLDYFREALTRGGNTPHIMDDAFAWHKRLWKTGTMQKSEVSRKEVPAGVVIA